jgi:phage-related protein
MKGERVLQYEITYYKDRAGKEPVLDYIKKLALKRDKSSRIKLGKILDYIRVLKREGKGVGQPYIKHLEGDIWELRPIRDRILFAAWDEDKGFILLHTFTKKTQKTPKREIDQAKRELLDAIAQEQEAERK